MYDTAFNLECFSFGKTLLSNPYCDWYHEEWRIPPRYIGNTTFDTSKGYLKMKAKMEFSGTWKARRGDREAIYHVGELYVLVCSRACIYNCRSLLSLCYFSRVVDSRHCISTRVTTVQLQLVNALGAPPLASPNRYSTHGILLSCFFNHLSTFIRCTLSTFQ